MEITINIDPSRIDYDEINKLIIDKIIGTDEDAFIKTIIDSRDEYCRLSDKDKIIDSLIRITERRVLSKYNDSYVSEYGDLTERGKEAVRKSVNETIAEKVNEILSPIVNTDEFKKFVLDTFSDNFSKVMLQELRNEVRRAVTINETEIMKASIDDLNRRVTLLINRLGVNIY